MGSVTIRNLDDAVKEAARLSAAKHGRSLEAELRALLERTYAPAGIDADHVRNVAGDDWVRDLIAIAGGADMTLPPRLNKVSQREIFGAD